MRISDNGETPLDLAILVGRDPEIADLLRKHGGKTKRADLKALMQNLTYARGAPCLIRPLIQLKKNLCG